MPASGLLQYNSDYVGGSKVLSHDPLSIGVHRIHGQLTMEKSSGRLVSSVLPYHHRQISSLLQTILIRKAPKPSVR